MPQRNNNRTLMIGTFSMLAALAIGGSVVAALAGGVLVPIAAVLVMAYAKGRLVILDFMELRESRGALRPALLAWPALLLALAIARSVAVAFIG